ncbi:hypothetical protein DMH26_14370 [Streptomyces sp. WAC 05379]|nr:hypothetical protein DMH26_14370 [Streptomyces sp. WAC 05379]
MPTAHRLRPEDEPFIPVVYEFIRQRTRDGSFWVQGSDLFREFKAFTYEQGLPSCGVGAMARIVERAGYPRRNMGKGPNRVAGHDGLSLIRR